MNANFRGIVSNLKFCRDLAAAALQKSIGTKQWVSLKQVSITLETADQLRSSQIPILGNRSNFAEVLRIVSNRIPKPASSMSCFGHSCSRHYRRWESGIDLSCGALFMGAGCGLGTPRPRDPGVVPEFFAF